MNGPQGRAAASPSWLTDVGAAIVHDRAESVPTCLETVSRDLDLCRAAVDPRSAAPAFHEETSSLPELPWRAKATQAGEPFNV
jgi:hypothetical protein